MRKELAKLEGTRATFRATFERFGTKSAYRGPPLRTALVLNVSTLSGRPVCDHLWFIVRKQLGALDLKPGDVIEFSAISKPYTKGYRGRRDDADLPPISTDYKLAWPQFFRRVGVEHAPAPVRSDPEQMSLAL